MADQSTIAGWVANALATLALWGATVKYLLGRIDDVKTTSAVGIDSAKHEAADNLLAHIQRTDSRIEQVRREQNENVAQLSGRIDRMGNEMSRKFDLLQATMTGRMDRVIELLRKE